MKNLRKTLLAGSALIAALAGNARAEPPQVFADATFRSSYTTGSGFTVVDNPVIQGTAGATIEGVSVSSWLNYDLKREHITEVDVQANIPLPGLPHFEDHLTASAYTAAFMFPELPIPDAQEIGINLNTQGLPFDIRAYGAKIFGRGSGHGFYASLAAGKTIEFIPEQERMPSVALGVTGLIGLNSHYFTQNTGFSNASLTLAAPMTHDRITIIPSVTFLKTNLDGRFNGVLEDKIHGGVSVSVNY